MTLLAEYEKEVIDIFGGTNSTLPTHSKLRCRKSYKVEKKLLEKNSYKAEFRITISCCHVLTFVP